MVDFGKQLQAAAVVEVVLAEVVVEMMVVVQVEMVVAVEVLDHLYYLLEGLV
jgi:hypothetical protein